MGNRQQLPHEPQSTYFGIKSIKFFLSYVCIWASMEMAMVQVVWNMEDKRIEVSQAWPSTCKSDSQHMRWAFVLCFKSFLHSKIWNKFIRPPQKNC